jgi:hypothetical protein
MLKEEKRSEEEEKNAKRNSSTPRGEERIKKLINATWRRTQKETDQRHVEKNAERN